MLPCSTYQLLSLALGARTIDRRERNDGNGPVQRAHAQAILGSSFCAKVVKGPRQLKKRKSFNDFLVARSPAVLLERRVHEASASSLRRRPPGGGNNRDDWPTLTVEAACNSLGQFDIH